MARIETNMETALVRLVNEYEHEFDIYLDHYQKIEFRIYNTGVLDNLLNKCEFVSIGNVYDYPDVLPQPDIVNVFDLTIDFDKFQRIAVSEKFNAVAFYTFQDYSIHVTILIDTMNIEKFSKKVKEILSQDSRSDLFRNVNFKCKKREYIEISAAIGNEMRPAEVTKKKVAKEKLVFHEDSPIVHVMNDIISFFKPETKKLYESMEIAYKRGIIIYGPPGNGKSAMIREIIRTIPKITKIVINPNVPAPTRILDALLKALNGKPAIVIIEDIDSLITSRNRSQFLNILDGVDVKSGVFFIGTTNYPEVIDPAFMNRSGRFDRTYEITNPSEPVRRKFFESRRVGKILSGYKVFKDENKPDSDEAVVDLFVEYSRDLPMASLKELITATKYALATNSTSIEETLQQAHEILMRSKREHEEAHGKLKNTPRRFRSDYEEDEY